jgi:hypothetical protein
MTNIFLTEKNSQKLNDIIFHEDLGLGKITILNDAVCEITYFKNNFKETLFPQDYKIGDDVIKYPLWGRSNFEFQINEEIYYPSFGTGKIVNFSKNGGVEVFTFCSEQIKKIGIKQLWKIENLKQKKDKLERERNERSRIANEREAFFEQAKKDKMEREKKQQEERNYLIENCGYKECEEVHDGKKCGNLHAPEFHMCHKCYIVSRGEKWYRNSYK